MSVINNYYASIEDDCRHLMYYPQLIVDATHNPYLDTTKWRAVSELEFNALVCVNNMLASEEGGWSYSEFFPADIASIIDYTKETFDTGPLRTVLDVLRNWCDEVDK